MTSAGAKLRIGLTGRMASGKGEAVRILNGFGFEYISLSDIVRREAARIHPEVNRSQLQDIGNRLRQNGGAGVLGMKVRDLIEASTTARWVIDGIRNPSEVTELKKMAGFFLIAIESEIPIVLDRLRKRGRQTDRLSEQELLASLEREWGNAEPDDGQQVGRCQAMADFIIFNNGSLAELQGGLEAVLKKTGA